MTGDVPAHGLHEQVSTMLELLLERFVIGGATRTCKQRGVAQPEWSQSREGHNNMTTSVGKHSEHVEESFYLWAHLFLYNYLFLHHHLFYITEYTVWAHASWKQALKIHMFLQRETTITQHPVLCYYAAFSHRFSADWRNSYQVRSSPHFVRKRVFWIAYLHTPFPVLLQLRGHHNMAAASHAASRRGCRRRLLLWNIPKLWHSGWK